MCWFVELYYQQQQSYFAMDQVTSEQRAKMEAVVRTFKAVDVALAACGMVDTILRPKQIACFDHIVHGNDLVAILPTGYGKSLVFQLLPFVLPVKSKKNIVIVIAPLTSIINDQMSVLKTRGISVGVLQVPHSHERIEIRNSHMKI